MTTRSRTILVIDDDVMIGELMATIIDAADYQTVVASNGSEGVRLAQALAPAIVFCDLSMPGMSGEDVIRALRADPRTAKISVVIMTGHVPSDARQFGADSLLQKPFRLDEVLPLLNSVVEENERRLAGAAAAPPMYLHAKETEMATLTGFEPVLPP